MAGSISIVQCCWHSCALALNLVSTFSSTNNTIPCVCVTLCGKCFSLLFTHISCLSQPQVGFPRVMTCISVLSLPSLPMDIPQTPQMQCVPSLTHHLFLNPSSQFCCLLPTTTSSISVLILSLSIQDQTQDIKVFHHQLSYFFMLPLILDG